MTPSIPKLDSVAPIEIAHPASLPAWFTVNRVHGHTRLKLADWGDSDEFREASAGFKSLGAHAFVRHVKHGGEDPWWPMGELPVRNVVAQFIADAHAKGLKIITYYWHMSQKTMEQLHPKWVCRRRNGTPIEAATRGNHLDITGPYREVVLNHLLELAAMGADGIMFDFHHLPARGTWGSPLARAWSDGPGNGAKPPAPDDCNEVYQQFLDFKARQIEDTFIYWRDRVKAEYPNVLFIVSSTVIPGLTDREMTTRLVSLADSSKNEYGLALRERFDKHVFDEDSQSKCTSAIPALKKPSDHVRQALGWAVLRDAADGRPPHIWAPGLPDCAHAQAFAGSLITLGCIANMDVHEFHLSEGTDGEVIPTGKTPLDALQAAFALGNTVSPHLAGTRALRWAAIHFSERARNARKGDFHAAWREVLWPLVGAYQTLTEDGVPVGIVNDQQLEHGELDRYRLLVLPDTGDLTASQHRAIEAFKTGGGAVIENDPAWPWSDPNAGDAAAAAFRRTLNRHIRAAPLRVTGGPSGRYAAAYYNSERLVVAVTNDFSWVQWQWTDDDINAPAPLAAGVRVTWRKDAGLLQGPDRAVQLRAVEAITGQTLNVERSPSVYRVILPRFKFMALLVVTREPYGTAV
jgi:hypothetical protein